MPQFFNKKLLLLLVGIIVLVALIGFSLREREELSWPEQFLKDTAGWFINIGNKPVSGVTGLVDDIRDLQHTYQENKQLKARLDEYVVLKTEVQDLKQENKSLREILDKKEDLSEYSPVQATVIGRNPVRWHEKLMINKGSFEGIEKNMAVITAKGLIGKIQSVTKFTATVQLLSSIDASTRVSAYIQGNKKAFGIIEGYDETTDHLLMKRIPYDLKLKKGSLVVTSGYGGIFPKGLPIGKVVDVKVDQQGLNQTAYLEPTTDLYDVSDVMVVKRAVAGSVNALDKEGAEE